MSLARAIEVDSAGYCQDSRGMSPQSSIAVSKDDNVSALTWLGNRFLGIFRELLCICVGPLLSGTCSYRSRGCLPDRMGRYFACYNPSGTNEERCTVLLCPISAQIGDYFRAANHISPLRFQAACCTVSNANQTEVAADMEFLSFVSAREVVR